MYVTIKLEGNVGTIHSVNVDGKETIPKLKYNIAPHKFVHTIIEVMKVLD